MATTPPEGRRAKAAGLLAVMLAALAACEVPPPDGRDLGLTVGAVPAALAVGEPAQVAVEVANHGGQGATVAAVGLLAPVSLDIAAEVDGTPCAVAGDDGALRLLRCDLGNLGPGATAHVDVTLTGAAVDPAAQLAVAAFSDGSEPAPDPHPNSSTHDVAVEVGPVDLHLVADRAPDQSLVGEPFDSISTVANRGDLPATGVVVTQTFPAGVGVTGATFERADGGATGACTVSPGLVSCHTDGHPVSPLAAPGDRWLLTATLVPADGYYFFLDHEVSSPHPEPVDAWPNEVRVTTGAQLRMLWIDPVGTVPVGTEFDVPVGFGDLFAQWASFSLPAGIEVVSATSGGTTHPCGPSSCTASPWYFFPPTTFRFRATAPTDPTSVGVYLSSEAGAAGGSFAVQVVDPEVGSELHPDLAEPEQGVVGEPLLVTGVVRNSGGADHHDVTVDVTATGVDVAAVRWGAFLVPCDDVGASLQCHVGTVAAHQVVPLLVELAPAAAGDATVTVEVASSTPQDDPDPVADQQVLSFPILDAYVDLGVTLAPNLDPATIDVPLQLTTTVTNHGTVTATGAELEVLAPATLPIASTGVVTSTPPGWGGCTTTAAAVDCELGDIAPGGSVTLRITIGVPTADGGTVAAGVVSEVDEPDPDPHPNQADHVVTVDSPAADLQLTMAQAQPVVAGEERTWELRGFNYGPSTTAATAVVTFPAGWVVSSFPQTPATVDCSLAGTVVTCQLAPMHGSGGNRRFNIVAGPTAPAEDAAVHAVLTSPLPDPGPRVHELTQTFDVLPRVVDLGLSTTESGDAVGGVVDPFTVTVTNAGPALAEDVVLTATFPESVRVDGATSTWSSVDCTVAGQTVTCTIADFYASWAIPVHFSIAHLTVGDPADFSFSVTSAMAEAPDATLPNTLEVTRTAVPGDARLRVFVEDVLGNTLPATVRVYRSTDALAPSYVAPLAPGGSWHEVLLPPGEYKVQVARAGFVTEWWDDQATRAAATTLVAAGLSERWDLVVVLAQAP